MTWRWVSRAGVLAIHAAQIEAHGGGIGLRDEALLESALARPRNLAIYGEPDAAALAAAYAFGIVRNHPFVDGNKRVGFVVAATFLRLNGFDLTASNADVVSAMLALASSAWDEEAGAAWFRRIIRPI